ncbi:MAG: hypothetical protein ABJN75_07100 [Hoeflea sp.]|uniref:hypothetical protein n=1 Tax=Hoeflea sp. TaxID=1940281 RepID=UPI003296B43E
MTVSNELMLAILAMDSYNRGYDAGIGDGQNVVDSVDTDGLGEAGSTIGNAAVIDVDLPLGSEAAGFYAIAYQWNGETVISYRGTDNPNPLAEGSDFWNGWTLGAGFPQASQGGLSIDFFESVVGDGDANFSAFDEGAGDGVIVTGHSLAGGLAGARPRGTGLILW